MILHDLVAFELWTDLIDFTCISGFQELDDTFLDHFCLHLINDTWLVWNTEYIVEWLRKHFELSIPTAECHGTQNDRHLGQLIILVQINVVLQKLLKILRFNLTHVHTIFLGVVSIKNNCHVLMLVFDEALRLLGEQPRILSSLIEVAVGVRVLIENEFWAVRLSSKNEVIEITAWLSTDSTLCLNLVYHDLFIDILFLFRLDEIILVINEV